MATTLQIAGKVTSGKQLGDTPRAVRIKDGVILASNRINTIKFDGFPKDIDCLVTAEDLLTAFNHTTHLRKLEQNKMTLTVKEDKFKADLMLLPVADYPVEPDHVPVGLEVEAGGFMQTIKAIAPFLKFEDSRAYILKGYAYVTDGKFLVRVPMDVEFPETAKPLTLTDTFADLVTQVERTPTKILVGEDTISVLFDGGYVESTRFSLPMIDNMTQAFETWMKDLTITETDENNNAIEKSLFEPLPDDVLASLKNMVKSASKGDRVTFGPMGISLMSGARMNMNVFHPMPSMIFDAVALKHILGISNEFNFDNPIRIAFQGPRIEGFWAAIGG